MHACVSSTHTRASATIFFFLPTAQGELAETEFREELLQTESAKYLIELQSFRHRVESKSVEIALLESKLQQNRGETAELEAQLHSLRDSLSAEKSLLEEAVEAKVACEQDIEQMQRKMAMLGMQLKKNNAQVPSGGTRRP